MAIKSIIQSLRNGHSRQSSNKDQQSHLSNYDTHKQQPRSPKYLSFNVGESNNSFRVAYRTFPLGSCLALKIIRPHQGTSIRDVDEFRIALSQGGKVIGRPHMSYYQEGIGMIGKWGLAQIGKDAVEERARFVRRELETFGMEFLEGISDDRLALRVTRIVNKAHNILDMPHKYFSIIPQTPHPGDREIPFRLGKNPFQQYEELLLSKMDVNIVSTGIIRSI